MNQPDNTIRVLNEFAEQYRSESDLCRKRLLLWRYLEQIQVIICKAGAYAFGQGESPSCDLMPLNELGELMICLNHGEVPSLLEPAGRTGRRASRNKQFFWANAAALIDVLMVRFGKSEEEAARAIAFELRRRGLLKDTSRSESPPWKLLQTWRDKIRNGEKGALARAWYDETLLFASFYETERKLYNAFLDPQLLPLEPLFGKTA